MKQFVVSAATWASVVAYGFGSYSLRSVGLGQVERVEEDMRIQYLMLRRLSEQTERERLWVARLTENRRSSLVPF